MIKRLTLLVLLACAAPAFAQESFVIRQQTLDDPENTPLPVHPLPSERQLLWNETEFYAFFHYGMNTFTDREWGNGDEDEQLYAPTGEPDPRQWLKAVKAAGMKGGIAVVKHHDGFCLWPTETTTHSILRAGNAFGRQTNIPERFAKAARSLGMKYGFYVSPWDRNSALYGDDHYVTDVFMRQCAELARYGSDQFEMWFDGANGGTGYYGGRGGSVTVDRDIYYDIPNLRDSVHKVCPMCVMWGEGGEARWIGNERGFAGETNWAMVDRGTESLAQKNTGQEDGWLWEPGESDAKMTTAGWFWHPDEQVLSAERLFQMYLETVGRNATLILNCPPDRRGLLPEATVSRLAELGRLLRARLGRNLATKATATASVTRTAGVHRQYKADNLIDGHKDTYWAAPDDTRSATLTLTWRKPQWLHYVMLQEPIRLGQRIKAFRIEASTDGRNWTPCATDIRTTTVGYKRIVPLQGTTAQSYGEGIPATHLRIIIEDSRACPLISNIAVY